MKTATTETKQSITDPNPITAAASALARAVDQAQRAIVVARNEPSPALVASEAKCKALEAKVRALEEAALLVHVQVATLQQNLRAAHQASAQRDTELGVKQRAIAQSENNCTVASVAKERTVWARERDDFAARVQELEHAEAALREDRTFLDDKQANFNSHRRASLANLKRTVSSLQAEVSKQERSLPAGAGMALGLSRKRRRVDSRLRTRQTHDEYYVD
ncbi:hypothetical protein FB451DRAFT_1193954 [Mycena latifolia]|nr:hypothetical protein FB451DRAFT_1193954 [Mycena latifolia]